MELVISHMSAIDFWRCVYHTDRKPEAPTRTPALDGGLAANEPDVWSLAPAWVTPEFLKPEGGVLHVMVRSGRDRRAAITHRAHQWAGAIPDGSVYDFGNGTYVCSPGFAFLQLASSLDLIELIALGCELCGCYSFDSSSERGFRTRRVPLATRESLAAFLSSAEGEYGQVKALRALSYVIERAASPREALVALLLTLPYRLGGYSLPTPLMNHRIDLAPAASRLCRKSHLYADLLYRDSALAIEYLGAHDHQGADAMRADRSRTNALAEMGFRVIELTSNQVNDAIAFDTIALQIAKHLKKRVRGEHRGTTRERTQLRNLLLAWNAQSGRQR